MQNTMLDSTVSQLLQDNSSMEYVAPETNPIATIQTDVESRTKLSDTSLFDFNAVHNGEACIESFDPKDRGTERQFRFTRALLCTLLGVKSEDTITNHVDKLLKRGAVTVTKNLVTVKIANSVGAVNETTLYDLKVFNYLVMRLDTDQAWEKKSKFNDVLVERETNARQCLPQDYESALEALLTEVRKNKALQAERDEAIRTKALIGSKREATAMATASAKARECEKLREQIGDAKTYKAVTAITWLPDYFDMSNRGLYGSLAANLKKVEAGMSTSFAHTNIPDSRYGTVKAYHVAVIERLHEMVQSDENLMKKYRKIASV